MMGGYDGFGGGMGFGGIGMLLFWGLIVAGVVVLVRWLLAGGSPGMTPPERGNTALEILDQRYAKGEIDREEFERMKQDLKG